MTTQDMRQIFIDQTGLGGDVMEYANPARSQVDTMFYTGTDPWHRIGTKLDAPATAAEAIEAAGLSWDVLLEPTYTRAPEFSSGIPQFQETGYNAVVREDTRKVFGIFSQRYTPLQNKDAFRFFDAVVGAGEAIYETAGSLKEGRRIWILASLPGDIGFDEDKMKRYVMLSNSHDGSAAIDMRFCTRRVICWNTFKMAMHNGSTNVRYKHVGQQHSGDSRPSKCLLH
jgi:phage/plasmid-like protein (TIGR03299 family)